MINGGKGREVGGVEEGGIEERRTMGRKEEKRKERREEGLEICWRWREGGREGEQFEVERMKVLVQ